MSVETTPLKLFYCYAREDKALRDELEIHLAGLKRQYNLTHWSDREITPGADWEQTIDEHLKTADIILLLISPHFVASDYCYGKEMQQALERYEEGSSCAIPILLRPTYWEDMPFSSIQLLPTDAEPITNWANRDKAFHDVAKGVGTAVKAFLLSRKTKEALKTPEVLQNNRSAGITVTKEITWRDERLQESPKKTSERLLPNEGRALYHLDRYEKAIHHNPKIAFNWSSKGYWLIQLRRYEEALSACEEAIRLDPNYTNAWFNKGTVLYNLNRHEEALSAFERFLRIDPDDFRVWRRKSEVLTKLNRTKEAEQAQEKADQLKKQQS